MILVEYGENKELFMTDTLCVPDAIKELYQYVKGGVDEDLFCMAIDGLRTEPAGNLVRFYNALACERPIHQIFTDAERYWSDDNDSCKDENEENF